MFQMLQILENPCHIGRRIVRDQRGVTAIITGIALTVLLGFAGLAIDVAVWLNATRGMQAAADQAAYSAAYAAGTNGCPNTSASTQALAVAAARGYTNGSNNTTVTTSCPSTSTFKVAISQIQPMWFSALFLSSAPTAGAQATAQLASRVSDLCVLALDGTNPAASQVGSQADATDLGGTTVLNLNCGLAVDSNSSMALSVGGHASLTATDIYLVGDDQGSPSGSATVATSPTANNILRHQPPIEDPYAGRDFSLPSTCASGVGGSGTADPSKVLPGLAFCGGLHLGQPGQGHNDTYNLAAGTYYVVGGSLNIDASATVNGTGVTFVLTGNALGQSGYASLTVNGSSSVSLSAPTSGPLGGLVFFQDRNAPAPTQAGTCSSANAQNKINGGATQLITGALYFPSQSVCFTGNSSTTGVGKCTQLIARTLDFTGTSSLQLSCTGSGIEPITYLVPTLIR